MTLYDLVNAMTIQGNTVEVKVFRDGEEVSSEFFDNVDDLSSEDIGEFEDMQVTYIYAYSFTRYYPNSSKQLACIVIELEDDRLDISQCSSAIWRAFTGVKPVKKKRKGDNYGNVRFAEGNI